jgi:hypothetical protein
VALPRFTKATMTDLVFSRGNLFPSLHRYDAIQRIGRSYAGTFRVATLRAPDESFVLLFERLPLADYTALVAWFTDARINWAANSFTYTDTAGVATVVRYLNSTLTMPEVAAGLYNVTLECLKEVA